jgi:hypothetical protein
MKIKPFAAALVVAVVMLCAGCTTGVKPMSVAQQLNIVCSNFGLVNTQLAAFNAVLVANPGTKALGDKATADLAAAQKPIQTLCASGQAITSTQLQTALAQALPAVAAVVATLPLPPAQQASVQGALVLAETTVGLAGIVEAQIQAAKTAPASTSTAPPPLQ